MSFWSGAGGSVIGAGAGLLSTGLSIYNTNSANKHAKRQAEQQRSWEERMSNTAHQREVEDLRKAGINPLMTATGGNGASTPNSAIAQTFMANEPDIANSAIGGMNASTKKKEQEQGERLIDSTITKNEAEVDNTTRDSLEYKKTQEAQRNLLQAEEAEARSRTALNNVRFNEDTLTSADRVEAQQAESRQLKGDAEFKDNDAYRWNEVLSNSAESYSRAFNNVASGIHGVRMSYPQNISHTSESFNQKGERVRYTESRTRKTRGK